MKQNYIFVLLLCMFASLGSVAQTINAVDDSYTPSMGPNGAFITSVRTNDLINGIVGGQSGCTSTVITLVSEINPSINFNLECGSISLPPWIQPGTYSFTYQICLANAPNVCDTATVTITVCTLNPPVLTAQQGECGSDMIPVTLSNLPPTGTWTLHYMYFNNAQQLQGTGSTVNLMLPPGQYTMRVVNQAGCQSPSGNYYVPYAETLAGSLNATFVDTNNNGQVNVGDIILYEVNVTNTMSCDITNVQPVGGNLVQAGSIASLPGNTSNNTGITASYVLTQADVNNGNFNGMIFLSGIYGSNDQAYTKLFDEFQLNITKGFRLIAFIDANANGVKDAGEQNYAGGQFSYKVNNGNPVEVYSSSGENVIYENNAANVYTLSYAVNNMWCSGQFSVTTPVYNNVTVGADNSITNYYFPLQVQPCTDVAVSMSTTGPVPGMPYHNYINIHNEGDVNASGTLTYTAPPGVAITSVSIPGTTPTATGFTYNFTNLGTGQYLNLHVTLTVPPIPGVALGDMLTSVAAVSGVAADSNPQNNTFVLLREVTGSYDPNDKAEAHGDTIPFATWTGSDYLTYTIRFENTGNGNANFIRIQDQLETQLDPSTVRMVAASHNYVLERRGSSLEWKFNNIQLPPSQPNSTTGKGYVTFQVKPYIGFTAGAIMKNTAAIFFDTNPAIITNTVITTFSDAMGTGEISGTGIAAYPNPVQNILNLSTGTSEIVSVTIADVSGQTVMQSKPKGNRIDVSSLSQGLYFVKVLLDSGGGNMIKIIKQ